MKTEIIYCVAVACRDKEHLPLAGISEFQEFWWISPEGTEVSSAGIRADLHPGTRFVRFKHQLPADLAA